MDKSTTTKDLLLELVRSLHWAEKELYETLPKLKPKIITSDLKKFIEKETEEKKTQQDRLEIILALLKEEPSGISASVGRHLKNIQREQKNAGKISDSLMIILNHAITVYLINMHQKAICCSAALGYKEVTRILRRSLHTEMGMAEKLRSLENRHIQ